jgi:LEA14-like dessication related protein
MLGVPALCAALGACSLLAPKFERPAVSVAGVEMVGGNMFQQTIRVTLAIHNPNDRALPVTSLHADLQVAGETIASGASSGAFVVPAGGDARCEIMVSANIALALVALAGQKNPQGAVQYELNGVVNIDLPLLRSQSFHEHGSFALP